MFLRLLWGERAKEGQPRRKDKQRFFREDRLLDFDIAFSEKADPHVRHIFGENDVGRVLWWRGRVEARGVRDRTTR